MKFTKRGIEFPVIIDTMGFGEGNKIEVAERMIKLGSAGAAISACVALSGLELLTHCCEFYKDTSDSGTVFELRNRIIDGTYRSK